MGFQVYNSQGEELQNLTGAAGGDLTGTYPNPTIGAGAVTDAKLAAALANNLGVNQSGVTNRSAMTAMTTERSSTAAGFVDVTGASLTFTVASGSYVLVGYNGQVKQGTDNYRSWVRVLANAAICNCQGDNSLHFNYSHIVDDNAYVQVGGCALFSAAEIGTGSQTFKWQMTCAGSGTVYVKNCYLTVTQVTF